MSMFLDVSESYIRKGYYLYSHQGYNLQGELLRPKGRSF